MFKLAFIRFLNLKRFNQFSKNLLNSQVIDFDDVNQ